MAAADLYLVLKPPKRDKNSDQKKKNVGKEFSRSSKMVRKNIKQNLDLRHDFSPGSFSRLPVPSFFLSLFSRQGTVKSYHLGLTPSLCISVFLSFHTKINFSYYY